MTGLHITGPCVAAYIRGCRCPDCRQMWRERRRQARGNQPSALAIEVARLSAELDAAELNLAALREENAMLYARIAQLETKPT